MNNLHVVFTMNPSSEGLKDRAATSPALFNRQVVTPFSHLSKEHLYRFTGTGISPPLYVLDCN